MAPISGFEPSGHWALSFCQVRSQPSLISPTDGTPKKCPTGAWCRSATKGLSR